jgi:Secretion system C-terminal sorting domain
MKQDQLLKRLMVMALLCLSFTWAVAQPSNDNCSGAINVACGGTYTGTLIGATPTPGGTSQLPNVWYRLTNAVGSVTVSLCNTVPSTWDSYIHVYSLDPGQPECGTSSIVGYSDNGCGGNSLLSSITFTADPAKVYYILVANYDKPSNMPATFTMSVSCTPSTAPPANDFPCNASTVYCGSSISGTTANATVDAGFSSPGVWYTIQGPGQPVSVSTCGASFGSQISIYANNCGSPSSVTPTSAAACTNGSTVTFNATQGTTYYILVNAGNTNASGNFPLNVQCVSPPANDYCTGASPLVCGSEVNSTTVNATSDLPYTSPGIWYTFTGTGALTTASLCATGVTFDSQIVIYKASGNAIVCTTGLNFVTSNDDYCGEHARVTWLAQLGATYYILVNGAAANDIGAFKLNLSCSMTITPPNDLCPNAIEVVCGGDYAGSTLTAGWDNPPGTFGVWYRYVGVPGNIVASVCDVSWDTKLWLYGGCGDMYPMLSEDDNCGKNGLQTQLPFTVDGTSEYYILVGGWSTNKGNFNLKITGPCLDEKMSSTSASSAESPANLAVTAFPNPSQGFVDFNVSVANAGEATIKIMDLAGHEIAIKSLGELQPGKHQFRHDWNGVPAGIYLYQVTVGKQQANGKLQVLR